MGLHQQVSGGPGGFLLIILLRSAREGGIREKTEVGERILKGGT